MNKPASKSWPGTFPVIPHHCHWCSLSSPKQGRVELGFTSIGRALKIAIHCRIQVCVVSKKPKHPCALTCELYLLKEWSHSPTIYFRCHLGQSSLPANTWEPDACPESSQSLSRWLNSVPCAPATGYHPALNEPVPQLQSPGITFICAPPTWLNLKYWQT